jgi:hypothetical protein
VIRYECDKCRCRLSATGADRFIAKIELYSAGGPVEFNEADMQRDAQEEIRAVLDRLSAADPDEIEDQNYRCLRFDLCVDCHRALLRNPLGPADR